MYGLHVKLIRTTIAIALTHAAACTTGQAEHAQTASPAASTVGTQAGRSAAGASVANGVAGSSAVVAEQTGTSGQAPRSTAGGSGTATTIAADAGLAPTTGNLDDDAGPAATATGRNSLGQTALPCEVQTVLRTSCQGCHAASPGLQAPMALVSREDLLASAITQPNRQVFELIRERVHSPSAPMPPVSSRRLTDTELSVLDAQVNAELQAGPVRCDDGTNPSGKPPDAYPAPDPTEIERCYPLLAHNVPTPGDSTPYRVPSGESHACFVFDIPWTGDAQALSIRSHQAPWVHHWLLSDQVNDIEGGQIIRETRDCNFGAQKIYGVSAINQQPDLNMPPGVGLQMPKGGSNVRFMVGMHYYNPGEPLDDTSGAEICVARTPRPETASIAELGVDFLLLPPHRNTDIVSTCKPQASRDIHILRSFPHMHARGAQLDTIIQRANGERTPLVDVAFDFNNQLAYDTDAVIHPGDTLLTTCHFVNQTDQTIIAGENTDNEMCINFVTAWPAGSLATKRDAAGAEACFE